ncbi:hypothetical protein GUJ93_ZPchr0001g31273 [Zizania palustris]|uniref:Uncharacterized protein n=1 Tax=Zizania palustris TaxID=103762 RepID=A0A8J5RT75_ZIZPA|nr:hypothetical protein GUJ93_ZPchr0001g31273 [Zizania palustris]
MSCSKRRAWLFVPPQYTTTANAREAIHSHLPLETGALVRALPEEKEEKNSLLFADDELFGGCGYHGAALGVDAIDVADTLLAQLLLLLVMLLTLGLDCSMSALGSAWNDDTSSYRAGHTAIVIKHTMK